MRSFFVGVGAEGMTAEGTGTDFGTMEIVTMIKLKNLGWVGILALLVGFGTTANAQPSKGDLAVAGSFTQSSNSVEAGPGPDKTAGNEDDVEAQPSAPTVAAELFGPGTGVKLEFGADGFKPIYKLSYIQATEYTDVTADPMTTGASTDHSVEAGDEGMITYMLSGATFAERVSPNDFEFAGDAEATLSIESGGAKGDPSVTVMVTAAAGWTGSTVITFTLPDVTATGRSARAPVRMSSSFSIDKTSNFPEGGPRNKACGETNADGSQASARGCKVVNAANKIDMFTLSGAAMGKIDLADRAKLIGADGKHMMEIAIGKVAVGVADVAGTEIKGQDGQAASLAGDLAGDVAISVASSQFRDGDIVYIDDNNSKGQDDARELFTIADGVATADRAIMAGSWTVRYIPNGKDALMHGTELKVSAMTDFTDRENMNLDAKMGDAKSITSMLDLNGIRPNPAMAYAIAPLSSMDMSNVRITCEAGKACTAFLSCHDGMGMDYFGDAGIEVPANGTVRLSQSDVSMALGMMEGEGWTGRLSCEVLSTAPISVQVLTRAEGVLVNNTYVGEGGMDDD